MESTHSRVTKKTYLLFSSTACTLASKATAAAWNWSIEAFRSTVKKNKSLIISIKKYYVTLKDWHVIKKNTG